MDYTLSILLIGGLCAAACALLGCFLVLRRMAMMADAISHAILPGLVAGYFIANGPNLFIGFLGAALAAVITVSLVEALQNTRRVGGESAIGIVFPAMFALGTFLVTRFAANVHLDADAVLFGNIEFAPFDPLLIGSANLGPQSIWVMAALCAMNLAFVGLFYKELKLATFDSGLAAALGFSPIIIHYLLMTTVSITAVGAFTAVGAVLVVALMIVPAAAAYLLTDRLPVMIGLAVAIGVFCSAAGYAVALVLDASVAGAISTWCGMCFALAHLFSPRDGVIVRIRRVRRQRLAFATDTLILHLSNHEGIPGEDHEAEVGHLRGELRWSARFAADVLELALRQGIARIRDGHLFLTEAGHGRAAQFKE
jgi:manganese/zinc/iron transport system permease protein